MRLVVSGGSGGWGGSSQIRTQSDADTGVVSPCLRSSFYALYNPKFSSGLSLSWFASFCMTVLLWERLANYTNYIPGRSVRENLVGHARGVGGTSEAGR